MKLRASLIAAALGAMLIAGCNSDDNDQVTGQTVRFAAYNASFDRSDPQTLPAEMAAGDNQQIKNVAEIIQRARPDVVLLNEFDHDGSGKNDRVVKDFIANYLNKPQHDAKAVDYPYYYIVPTNTGLAEFDLNDDGKITLPDDAYGFGLYHGQYGFIVLSKYELDTGNIRSFRTFLWKDMPDAVLPDKFEREPDTGKNVDTGEPYYSENTLRHLRLSSKNHIDIPVKIRGDKTVHLLAMHPTPPIFDGDEDRNGRRNFDEIRLFSDYISDDYTKNAYLVDDQGNKGGIGDDASFVIAGDLNADPVDGDSYNHAVTQLLAHPRVAREVAVGNMVPASTGGKNYSNDDSADRKGLAEYWTHIKPLRLDYVLPSSDLNVIDTGVYWQAEGEDYRYLFENDKGEQGKTVSSDHRLVWVDIKSD